MDTTETTRLRALRERVAMFTGEVLIDRDMLLSIIDAAERVTAERDQLVADAAATAARSVEEWADVARLVGLDRTALPLDVRRAVEHELAERDAARAEVDRLTLVAAGPALIGAVLEITRKTLGAVDGEATPVAAQRVVCERDALLALAPHPSKRTGLRCVRCGRDGGVDRGDDAPVCDVCDGAVAMEVERDALLALCERFGGEDGVICNGYEDDSGCGGCGANANHSDDDPANHAPDCVRLAARVLAAKIRARGEGGQ